MGAPQAATAEPLAAAGVGPAGQQAAGRRRPWWVWAGPFVLVLTVLVVRSRFLFTARFYEQGDAAANSILIEQAKHLTLLVGNYSRVRFNHPGPAYMYVQALGEWLLADLLHLVPTAWNAHVLAVFALNSAFVAMMAAVVYGWTRSLRGAVVGVAVVLACVATEPWILSYDWMTWMYVPAYIAFAIAAGSVAAGAERDLWILTLTGWFLIHGHASFLFFVPVILAAAAAAVMWRYGPRAALRRFTRPRNQVPVTVISAVFALPIAVNLALHWPGDFGKYLSYSSSRSAGGHGVSQILHYALWYWWQRGGGWAAWLVPAVSYLVAVAVVRLSRSPVRRFLVALLAINIVSTLAFLCYTAIGVDVLSERYIGYFYFSAPLITLLVIAVSLTEGLPLGALAAPVLAVLAVIAFAAAPATAVNTGDTDAALPGAVSAVAASAHGKTIVIYFDHNAWPDVTGFLVQAERTGVRACVRSPWWRFMMTSKFICTPAQIFSGTPFWFKAPAAPHTVPVMATLKNSAITVGAA
jgi:hypothetical protein